MKNKFIIFVVFVVLGLFAFIGTNAYYDDYKLMQVWNKRPDLQKAFPNASQEKLEWWATNWGWSEDPILYEYSEIYKQCVSLVNNKFTQLNSRVSNLEVQNNKQSNDNKNVDEGNWMRCCFRGNVFYCPEVQNAMRTKPNPDKCSVNEIEVMIKTKNLKLIKNSYEK